MKDMPSEHTFGLSCKIFDIVCVFMLGCLFVFVFMDMDMNMLL